MAKVLSVIGSPGLTVSFTIERASDGYFWNGSGWQAAAATVDATEVAGYATGFSEYYTATNPTAYCFWKAKDSKGNLLARGEFAIVSILLTPLTAATNSVLQSGQQVEVVIGNKGMLFTVALDGDWTAYDFRFSAKDEADSSAYAIGPNDVAVGDIVLGTDADGNAITTISVRFTEGDLDIAEGVYVAELTADTGGSSGAALVTPIQFPLKVIPGLIG